MDKQKFKKRFFLVLQTLLCSLLIVVFVRLFFSNKEAKKIIDENSRLIVRIEDLTVDVEDRNKTISDLNIKAQKTEIIEKELIVYKDGELIVPKDYEELKENYIVLSDINKKQKSLIEDLEKKSQIDDKLIIDLSLALKDAQKQLEDSNDYISNPFKTKFFQHSFLLGYDFNSVEATYLLLILNRVYIGGGITNDLRAKICVGVKL